jgi:AraC-like DNA-binding protein
VEVMDDPKMLSKFHLVRQFRTVTGVPPHTFQIGQRVVRARRLLQAGIPPATVAALTGFVDQSHLHRHFRRRLGVTPTRYVHASPAIDAHAGSRLATSDPAC